MRPNDHEKPCPACNGTGKYYDFDQMRDCPMCDEDEETQNYNVQVAIGPPRLKGETLAQYIERNTEATEPSQPRRQVTREEQIMEQKEREELDANCRRAGYPPMSCQESFWRIKEEL